GVKVVVRQMREIRPLGPDVARSGDRFRNAQMRWMLRPEECVDHQYASSPQERDRVRRERLCVGYIGQRSNPVCKDCDSAVWNGHRHDVDISDAELTSRFDHMRLPFWL